MKFVIYKTSDRYKPYESPVNKAKKVKTEKSFYYEIEINTLNELMELIHNQGEIVMHDKDVYQEIPAIEIYDAYRE